MRKRAQDIIELVFKVAGGYMYGATREAVELLDKVEAELTAAVKEEREKRTKIEAVARELISAISADVPYGGSDKYHKRIYKARDALAALLTE